MGEDRNEGERIMSLIKGLAQAKADGEDVTIGMIIALVVAVSLGVVAVYGFPAIVPYIAGVVAGVLFEAVIIHIQRYC
jgi:hypothetical protein